MDTEHLTAELTRLLDHKFDNPEHAHVVADILLLDAIDDPGVTDAWANINRGYHLTHTRESAPVNNMQKHKFDHDTIRSLGYTSHKLAIESDVSYVQMLKYINGSALPSFKAARRMSTVLNVPLDSLEFAGEINQPVTEPVTVCQNQ